MPLTKTGCFRVKWVYNMNNLFTLTRKMAGGRASRWAAILTLLALLLVFAGWRGSQANQKRTAATPTTLPQAVSSDQLMALPPFQARTVTTAITRLADLRTYRPERPRFGLTGYEIQEGDTAWSIAEKFGLRMESILWGNENLSADAGSLQIGRVINILPLDGVVHTVQKDETWERIELLHGVKREQIIAFIGNPFPEDRSPELVAGQQLIIPGGRNQVVWTDPGPPVDPSKGRLSPGFYQGALTGVGTGVYILPVSPIRITQPFWEGHPALDFDTVTGQAVWAADGGTVIYSGWSESGYGNLVIIDHGTGYWTYYAHNDYNLVSVGQAVYQGQHIAASGNTGRSSGDHLDFRIRVAGRNFIDPTPLLPLP
jgi:murein DD-endopeptidase MepM/ murein hydrolase activator NlpD